MEQFESAFEKLTTTIGVVQSKCATFDVIELIETFIYRFKEETHNLEQIIEQYKISKLESQNHNRIQQAEIESKFITNILQEEQFREQRFIIKSILEEGVEINSLREHQWTIRVQGVAKLGGGEYKQGQKRGQWHEVMTVQNGLQIYFHIGQYLNGLRTGEWQWQDVAKSWRYQIIISDSLEDHTQKELKLVNGMKQRSMYINLDSYSYWECGQYEKGLRVGKWIFKNLSGTKQFGFVNYENDLKQGRCCEPDEKKFGLFHHGEYLNGQRIGEWKIIPYRYPIDPIICA